MKKWAAIFAFAGALWMIVVLVSGSLLLAEISNYPGVYAARWLQFRGIAPSPAMIWGFKLWLVLTCAVEWLVVGLGVRAIGQRFLS